MEPQGDPPRPIPHDHARTPPVDSRRRHHSRTGSRPRPQQAFCAASALRRHVGARGGGHLPCRRPSTNPACTSPDRGRIGRQIRGARRVVGRMVARHHQFLSVEDHRRHAGQGSPRRCIGRRSRHASAPARTRHCRSRWAARGVSRDRPARHRRRWRHLDRRQRTTHAPRHHHRTRRRTEPLPASSWRTRGPTTLRRAAVRRTIRGRADGHRALRRT